MESVDLLVVGGGINGVGIARDAAGRGLNVALVEKYDLASHTSSWSTKLIHGGLRYLEHGEFRLVRESLIEREVLLDAAPHLVRPLRFILPHHDGLRPGWMLRFGLFLYDHIGGRRMLAPTETRNLRKTAYGVPLQEQFVTGFEYTDCRVDDSRLVVLNAVAAAQKGAAIHCRTTFERAERTNRGWVAGCLSDSGDRITYRTPTIVNAAGPWVTSLFDRIEGSEPTKKLRLVKGSHLIMRKLYDHDRAYIFQNRDGRIIFLIPYVNGTTLLGTTDVPYEGDPAKASISEEETDYLLAAASEYLRSAPTREDILGSFSGVRPLYDELGTEEASAVTRDYAFDIETDRGATLLSVYGGKLTTYRKLAEHALEKLQVALPAMGPAWTRDAALPGGEGGFEAFPMFRTVMEERFGWLGEARLDRMLMAYGRRLEMVLGAASSPQQLGTDFGAGLTEVEIRYLIREEWATCADDVLHRRTKLGEWVQGPDADAVDAFIQAERGAGNVAK